MFSHVIVGANDLERSKRFYDATLTVLGAPDAVQDKDSRWFWFTKHGMFGVTRPIDGEDATHANGGTIGFAAGSPEVVDAWHAAGVSNGGKTCEDPPGVRVMNSGSKLYLAYLRDPDGNKLCAMHRLPA